MINPLPFLALTNTSLTYHPTLDCWAQAPPTEPQLLPVIYKECRKAIASMPAGEKFLAPLTFSRREGAGFKVPDWWEHGNCNVGLDVRGNEDGERGGGGDEGDGEGMEETETFAAILKRAWDLAVECVIKPPHLGGKSRLGVNGGLEVAIFGDPGGEFVD